MHRDIILSHSTDTSVKIVYDRSKPTIILISCWMRKLELLLLLLLLKGEPRSRRPVKICYRGKYQRNNET